MSAPKLYSTLSLAALLCCTSTTQAHDSGGYSFDTLQDTIPHCGKIKTTGPLCSASSANYKNRVLSDDVLAKALEMSKQLKRERAREEAKLKESGPQKGKLH